MARAVPVRGDRATWRLAADRVKLTLSYASTLIEADADAGRLSWYDAVEMIEAEFRAKAEGRSYTPPPGATHTFGG
jgi:hypothetical protein